MVNGWRHGRGACIGLRCVFADAAWPWRDWRRFSRTLGTGVDMTHSLPALADSVAEMRKIRDQRLVIGWNAVQRRLFPPAGGGPETLGTLFSAYAGVLRENRQNYAALEVENERALRAKGFGLYSRHRHLLQQGAALRSHIRLLDGMANEMERLGARVDELGPQGQDAMIRSMRRDLRRAGFAP
jgi:hypothetical protein